MPLRRRCPDHRTGVGDHVDGTTARIWRRALQYALGQRQHAKPERCVNLVRRERQGVHPSLGHVDVPVRRELSGIHEQQGAVRMAALGQRPQIRAEPGQVRRTGDRNQLDPSPIPSEQLVEMVQIHRATVISPNGDHIGRVVVAPRQVIRGVLNL